MERRIVSLIAAGLVLTPLTAFAAQPEPAPAQPAVPAATAVPQPAPRLAINGFRSARFGMHQAEVRAAIRTDFGKAVKIGTAANPAEGTTALTVTLPKLDPGPGPARVTYIFGATGKELIHVNVAWKTGDKPSEAERQAMVQGGLELTAYFRSQPGKPKAVTAGVTTADAVILYAAVDDSGASVEVRVSGVGFERTVDGKPVSSPPPSGAASLVVSYARNALHPDIKTLARGSF